MPGDTPRPPRSAVNCRSACLNGAMPDPQYRARKDAARANRGFYQAFEQLDLAAMQAVWLDAPSIK